MSGPLGPHQYVSVGKPDHTARVPCTAPTDPLRCAATSTPCPPQPTPPRPRAAPTQRRGYTPTHPPPTHHPHPPTHHPLTYLTHPPTRRPPTSPFPPTRVATPPTAPSPAPQSLAAGELGRATPPGLALPCPAQTGRTHGIRSRVLHAYPPLPSGRRDPLHPSPGVVALCAGKGELSVSLHSMARRGRYGASGLPGRAPRD